jgi:DnaJ-class molecular chaperone
VTRLSSTKEIKQAYRRIALISHPDKVTPEQRDDATRMFQEIQVAYDVLQDPIRRQEYDDQIFGPEYTLGGSEQSPTSPTSSFDEHYYSREYGYGSESPRTPETPRSYARESGYWRQESRNTFDAKREFKEYVKKSRVLSFKEASLLFHPEDRRHLWLCSEEDDPEYLAGPQLIKPLYVNLQEFLPLLPSTKLTS